MILFIGYMLDRLYFWIFTVLVVASSAAILGIAFSAKLYATVQHEKHQMNNQIMAGVESLHKEGDFLEEPC